MRVSRSYTEPVTGVWGAERRSLPAPLLRSRHDVTGNTEPVGGVWGAERRALPPQLD